MSCQHLVCANCNGRVADGGCAVCRSSRAQLHESSPWSPAALLALLGTLITAVLLALAGARAFALS